jgi:hypothetical protein
LPISNVVEDIKSNLTAWWIRDLRWNL